MIATFKSLSESICKLVHDEGIVIRPYSNPRLPFFLSLDEAEQKSALANLKAYLDICESVKAKGYSLKDTRLLTDEALERLNLSADKKDLNVIKHNHLVEIYNLQHTQIFRSFRFFEVSSYTLEDICCRKWWHLYERSAENESLIQKIVADFLATENKTALKVKMPQHLIREKDTLERLIVRTQLLWIIPLFRGTELAGLMAIEESSLENHLGKID